MIAPPATPMTWFYSHHDYNLYAAFPSLHAGFPVLAAAAAWRMNKAVGFALSIWAIVVWVTVVYLGGHYVADVVGGILYAGIALIIVALLSHDPTRGIKSVASEQVGSLRSNG